MIRGSFLLNPANVPVVPLTTSSGDVVVLPTFLLDTGFSGDIKVNADTASDLGLMPIGIEKVSIADGSIVEVPVAIGKVLMEGQVQPVRIFVGSGSPLAGIGLLTKFGYRASIDCKNRTVELERMP